MKTLVIGKFGTSAQLRFEVIEEDNKKIYKYQDKIFSSELEVTKFAEDILKRG